MKTISSALLAAALVATASASRPARHHQSSNQHSEPAPVALNPKLSKESFVKSDEASEYDGFKMDVEFYSSPMADKDLTFLHSLKATMMRLDGGAVDFHPHMVVRRGQALSCRNSDGSAKDPLPEDCVNRCINDGRYCSIEEGSTHNSHTTGLAGHYYVQQSARDSCIFEEFVYGNGEEDLYNYFQYHDAMKATGCDHSFSTSCLDQVSNSVGFDQDTINQCVGNLDIDADVQNTALERELNADQHPANVPALYVNGREVTNFPDKINTKNVTNSILQTICDAMPHNSRYPKPPVCDFCLNWCPTIAGNSFDLDTCLWELQCGDGVETFDMYLEVNDATREQENHGNGYLHVIATVLAIILAVGLTALTCMAIRVWRTKMIIDRYVKEQQAMNSNAGGVNGHRDPTFFPEDNELDLDLEPALQYSDHLHVPPSSAPPSRANFLPQLT